MKIKLLESVGTKIRSACFEIRSWTGESDMRKIVIALSAAAACALAAFAPANAVPLGNPSGLAAAQEEIDGIDKVHCVPGWAHHYPTSWRRANGCPRYYRGGAVIIGTSWGYRSYGFRSHRGHGFRGGHRWRR
jgi:hypothetical protein